MNYYPCTSCNSGWEIAEGESFCGWCGKPTIGFSAELVHPDSLLYADELVERAEPLNIAFVIKNTGINSVEIDKPRVKEE